MVGVPATYRSGKVELSGPVGWPDGTQLEVVPIQPGAGAPSVTDNRQAESYREFIERLVGSFGDEPLERPPQGDNEKREEW
jgi:hypothetical protein